MMIQHVAKHLIGSVLAFSALACVTAHAAPLGNTNQPLLSHAGAPPPSVTRGFAKAPNRKAHALIMTIGNYQGNIPKLKGVPFDTASATEISQRMGVPPKNITVLNDEALTLEGMRKALDALESRLDGDDQVFIYYSGHGGRQLLQEPNGERCAESLITVDGQGMFDVELESRLRQLSQKTQKTIVFLDACHSGGVTTRAVGQPLFSPKSYTPSNLSCTKPSNILTRSIIVSKIPGSGGGNFVHFAAARDDEVSLDQPGRGGVATQAWLSCMSGEPSDVDTDGSGGLSADEIRVCAQKKIALQLRDAQGFSAHHVTLTGNTGMVLSFAVTQPQPQPAAPAPAPATTAAAISVPVDALVTSPVALPVKPPATATTPPSATTAVAPAAMSALMDIYNSRDDRRLVTLTAGKTHLKIGQDALDLQLTSREAGYLYLLMVGSDGKTFDLLFPNKLDPDNQIAAGGSMRLPRPSWELSAGGPPGRDTLLAIVTDAPRDFRDAGLTPAGPFSSVQAHAAKSIQLVTGNVRTAGADECGRATTTRNLVVNKRCSTSYGAALLQIEEVR